MNYVICHYNEIGLKGKNRKFFEEKLVENIKRSLPASGFDFVKRISGRIIVGLGKKRGDAAEIEDALKKVFGIANFSFGESCGQKAEEIEKASLEILKKEKFKTFRIACQRGKKDFPLTSQQVNERVGRRVLKEIGGKVSLEKPELTLFIEIVEKYAFLYTRKIRGAGGLPVGVSGKAAALLSGGIDSPVAAFKIMKRGARLLFVHFHSFPYTEKASLEKAEKLAGILNLYQGKSKLYLVPFADIQKEILLKTPAKLRVILYRRFMFRIAKAIAKKEGASALVTGESLGQVASQTMQNMEAVEEAVGPLVLRPLAGEDKEEIIRAAKEIGTFDVSILPHEDCCARFLPDHPETRARLPEIEAAEKKLKTGKLIDSALKNSRVKTIH